MMRRITSGLLVATALMLGACAQPEMSPDTQSAVDLISNTRDCELLYRFVDASGAYVRDHPGTDRAAEFAVIADTADERQQQIGCYVH
jgi:hypothetical protein